MHIAVHQQTATLISVEVGDGEALCAQTSYQIIEGVAELDGIMFFQSFSQFLLAEAFQIGVGDVYFTFMWFFRAAFSSKR